MTVASEISVCKNPGLIPMGVVQCGRNEVIVVTKFCNKGPLKNVVNELDTLQQIQALNDVGRG